MPTRTGIACPAAASADSRARLTERERVQRRAAADALVLFHDELEPLGRHAAPARDVVEERPHLAGRGRPAERDQHDGVVGHRRSLSSWTISTRAFTCSTG